MNRRSMFRAALFLPAAAAAVAAKPIPADEHVYKGNRIRWAGWRDSPNQFVTFGFWVAHGAETRHGLPVYRYATTLGVCDVAADAETIDTSRPRTWDASFMPEPHEREALKARALRLLYEHL